MINKSKATAGKSKKISNLYTNLSSFFQLKIQVFHNCVLFDWLNSDKYE